MVHYYQKDGDGISDAKKQQNVTENQKGEDGLSRRFIKQVREKTK